ncbi:ABC transporter permease [Longimicrobium sp.]|uniref:ABC transporter permease n=1 Tax=Longimicrobium sp. TaxID=2029185 RepID=UPI002CE6F129|nr:ABC transporter permease [Longimicrobium sp.]HSU17576.1 ABC transporter permease [Longimicrobium sp.]
MRTGISWLDFKLGARMLVKYPALTLVGGLGMAVAIAIGAALFDVIQAYLDPTIPLDQGERIVAIQSWDAARGHRTHPSLHDFAAWKDEVRSFEPLGAFQPHWRNLVAADGQAEPVQVAEMNAAGFRVARVPPLLGRPLTADDERKGAPPVLVIAWDVWQTRFAGDPHVLGRTLQLGDQRYTVVGVMPKGFAFPMNHHLWAAMREDPADYAEGKSPPVFVFGRMAQGVTPERAQAELTAIGARTAVTAPGTHERLQPRIVPYTYPLLGLDDDGDPAEMHMMQFMVSLLLVVVCANVAILVYARTVTRQGEITVRSALGASRRRIVAQLFVEALVLSAAAAAVGLVLAAVGLKQAHELMLQEMAGGAPFWMKLHLSSTTVIYVAGLTVLAAVIAGVLPAVQATGQQLQSSLRQLGGGTGLRLGKTWTALIILQVAFAVAVLPAAVFTVWDSVRHATFQAGFAADQFLSATVAMDGELPPSAEARQYQADYSARFAGYQAELVRRLKADPGVTAVTVALALPGSEPKSLVEVDGAKGAGAETATGHQARRSRVDAEFFGAFDAPVLSGRGFYEGDFNAASTAVVVNRAFVKQFLGGGNAVGRRVRYVSTRDEPPPPDVEDGRWYEIVGVVRDLPATAMEPGDVEARMYHPLVPGQVYPVSIGVKVGRGSPAAFAGRLREVATALDPALRLHDVLPLDEVYRKSQVATRLTAWALALVTLSVLLLSAAGIYALMSFTVAQRRREIGIRSALGAHPRQIVGAIFSRAVVQLAAGVVVGAVVAALLDLGSGGTLMQGHAAVLLPVVGVLMLLVGLLAAVIPARRGLRIEPTEALRAA